MRDWGLHWYYNNKSLVHRRGVTPDGFPWKHASNAFAKVYNYDRGTLPNCDAAAECSAILLAVSACIADEDIEDVVGAFRKVATAIL